MNHTKGPWVHEGGGYVADSNGGSIADAYIGPARTQEETLANGELLAAAPELLDALILLWAFLDDVRESNPGWVGNLCLQDYGLMNLAYLKTEAVLRKFGKEDPES